VSCLRDKGDIYENCKGTGGTDGNGGTSQGTNFDGAGAGFKTDEQSSAAKSSGIYPAKSYYNGLTGGIFPSQGGQDGGFGGGGHGAYGGSGGGGGYSGGSPGNNNIFPAAGGGASFIKGTGTVLSASATREAPGHGFVIITYEGSSPAADPSASFPTGYTPM